MADGFKKKLQKKLQKKQDMNPPPKKTINIQSKPRICLIDIENSVEEKLSSLGFNLSNGTLGNPVVVNNTNVFDSKLCLLNTHFPSNLQEHDIVVLDLKMPSTIPYKVEEHTRKPNDDNPFYFICKYPLKKFDPRPFGAFQLKSELEKIFMHQGILIVFSNSNYKYDYTFGEIKYGNRSIRDQNETSLEIYSFYESMPKTNSIIGDEIIYNNKYPKFDFLKRYIEGSRYGVTFKQPLHYEGYDTENDMFFLPLLFNNRQEIVGFIKFDKQNIVFVLPQIIDKSNFLAELLTNILPDIKPSLFPYNSTFNWIKEELYTLPNELNLIESQRNLKLECERKVNEIQILIEENYEKFKCLHNLLIETGNTLVLSVKNFLGFLGFENILLMDEINGKLLQEDLQIEINNNLLVIEVKGIGGTSTDSDCSQIDKVVNRKYRDHKYDNIYGIYIVNHQRYQPPLKRKNPPFTQLQIDDAISCNRGLLSTWQLFNLFYSIKNEAITKQEARRALLQPGLISFKPDNVVLLGVPKKILYEGYVILLDVSTIIHKDDVLIIKSKDIYNIARIEEIRVNNEIVEEANPGGVGIKVNIKVNQKDEVFLKTNQI